MASGLNALHEIDRAIVKARRNVSEAARLPGRAASALAEVAKKQAQAYETIARVRLEIMEEGGGDGSLGYVDRQAAKLLAAHGREEQRLLAKAEASSVKIAKLEAARRAQEKSVEKAVKAYEMAAETCRKNLLTQPEYKELLKNADKAERVLARAQTKLELAQKDVVEKGQPYRDDPYFQYLHNRHFGTKNAKGWFLTKWFDGILARRGNYRAAALNYKRLTDIPERLKAHVVVLREKHQQAGIDVEMAETKALVAAGVTKLKSASLAAQKKLDNIDQKIESAETMHGEIRAEHARLSAGDSPQFKQAIELLVSTLRRKNLPGLERLALATISPDDDRAIGRIAELAEQANQLERDQVEARKILEKYQDNLRALEHLRRKFKNRQYDAPSSQFPQRSLMGSLLGQLLSGLLSSGEVWRQIERAQRTVHRSRGPRSRRRGGFGGVDWGEAMRLPKNTGGFGGGWGGGSRSPRMPRPPRIRLPRGGSGGGFRTGGGF